MRKSELQNLQIYVTESFDRDRAILALRLDDILDKDPDFEVDELLVYRKQRDDLWTQDVRDKDGVLVEGVRPGYVAVSDMLLAVYEKNVASVGRQEVLVRVLTDLYEDADFYIDEYAEVARRLVDIPEVAQQVRADEERKREEAERRTIAIEEARRRVDGE